MSLYTPLTFLLIYSLKIISADNVTNYRLPNNTKPHLYVIELDFDLFGGYMPVTGKSIITFEIIEPTNSIVFHKANNVLIDEEYTEVQSRDVVEQLSSPQELYQIKLSSNLTFGNYSLKLKWRINNNNSDDVGFFRYEEKVNSRIVAGTINLAPTKARKVFPCWDEPFYRSEFKISVKHAKSVTALSNMPAIERKFVDADTVLTTFDKSPRLSPHSIGIALTDFAVIKKQFCNISFYSTEQDTKKIKNLLLTTNKILLLLEKYTKIRYPVPKLDVIILSSSLPELTVQNLGLMVLNSADVDFPKIKSEMALYQYKKTAIINLAEALSFHWFGHLVSPSWWNYLWLSYGISHFVAAEIIDQIFDNETTKARDWLSIDSYKSFRGPMAYPPIQFPPYFDNPKQIKGQLDVFPVARDVLFVQMLEHFASKKVFQSVLQNYLKKNKFHAVTTEDLWSCFPKKSDFNIQQMDPWLQNYGYVVLEVSHDLKTNSVRIIQNNILKNFNNSTQVIPINYATTSNPNFSNTEHVFWMHNNNSVIHLLDKNDWIILNIQQLDQYRVKYDKENWNRIIKYLNTNEFDKIHPINRAIIIKEVNEMPINEENLKLILDLLPYLRQEKNLLALSSAYSLIFRLSGELTWPLVSGFSEYMSLILEPVIKNVEQDVDNYFYKRAKSLKLLFMRIHCSLNKTSSCNEFAIETVNYILAHPSEEIYLHDYSYSWTLCLVLNDYDEDQWDYFFSNNYPLLRDNLYGKYRYLRCSKRAEVVREYFPKLLEDNIANSIDEFMAIFNFVIKYADDDRIQIILEYYIQNFDLLEQRFRDETFNEVINNMLIILRVFIKNQRQRDQLESFLDKKSNGTEIHGVKTFLYPRFSTIEENDPFEVIILQKLTEMRGI